jgi:hypothetical protein
VHLTDEQGQEMERLLVLRILGDATEEYSFALAELQQRDEFRRYMMRRAESSGFTIEEIAAATAQSAPDVDAFLHDAAEAPAPVVASAVEDGPTDARELEIVASTELSALDEEGFLHDDVESAVDASGSADADRGYTQEDDRSQAEEGAADARELDDLTDTIKHLTMQIGSDDGDGNEVAAMAAPETPDVPAITSWPWNRS